MNDVSHAITDAKRAWRDAERAALEDALYRQIEEAGLPLPERQYRYARPRKVRADFAYPAVKLLIEVEGGVFQQAATGHRSISGVVRDMDRANLAAVNGWRVLRFHVDQISDRSAVEMIREALR